MVEFDTPECTNGHDPVTMSFLESHDPLDDDGNCGPDEDCTDWRQRWRYSCPECGRVVEMRETLDGDVEEETVRENEQTRSDPTSLSPVADWD
jgi:hypothetical protein